MGTPTYPTTVPEILASMGEACNRLNALDAVEAGAGNISCAVSFDVDLPSHFNFSKNIELPLAAPTLRGYTVFVTGSGCRLRDIMAAPLDNVGAVVVGADGLHGTLHYNEDGNFRKPTSEFNSHIAVHQDQIERRSLPISAVIHAQPPHLVRMTHIPRYQDTDRLNQALIRWEPETIVQLPSGVVFLPFMVPGSQELMEANVTGLRKASITIWSKHGLMAHSDVSPLAACDKIEYAETGAMYELANRSTGGDAEGLSREEIRQVVDAFGVATERTPSDSAMWHATPSLLLSSPERERTAMAKKVSMHDVAAAAGVSVGTVSHALNHPDRVAASTLNRVRHAIDELGFVRSGSARQLRAGTSTTVGLIVQSLQNPYYVEAAHAIEQRLAEHDLALLLCTSQGDPARERRVVQMLVEHQVRAAIVAAEVGATRMVKTLLGRRVHTVVMDSPGVGDDVLTVGVDDISGGELAVRHLLELGHRRIGVAMGPLDVRQSADRWLGAKRAVSASGLDPETVLTLASGPSFSADTGADLMTQLLTLPEPVSAAFCGNDQMAIGAMRTLRARGIAIPDAMALVGYDDIAVSAELITPLTSVKQPLLQIGAMAADMALADPTGKVQALHESHPLFAPQLVIRKSTTGQ